MFTYTAKRILQLVPTLFVILTAVFILVHLTPGDPVEIMFMAEDQQLDPAEIEAVREAMGLADPMHIQYGRFLAGAVRGDLGKSYYTRQEIMPTVLGRLPNTILLTITSMTLSLLIAIPAGILSSIKPYSLVDNTSMTFAMLGVSIPRFWLGLLLILLFSLTLGWLPSSGMRTLSDGLWTSIRHLMLPTIALGLGLAALTTRLTRSSMLEVIKEDYVRTARAKGVMERTVVFKHALRNALIPVVTMVGIQFGRLLGGAVIVETIFAWPGVGRLAVSAILRRDFPMIQGVVLIVCTTFVLMNLLVDLSYALLNPKIRYS